MDDKNFQALTDEHLTALCVYAEARNQGLDGMLAVAAVITNRAAHPAWWGHDIKSVILKNSQNVQGLWVYQFSWLMERDPQRAHMEQLALGFEKSLELLPVLKQCLWIVKGLNLHYFFSNVGPATHYHTKAVKPSWAKDLKFLTQIKDHLFYV